MKLTRRSLQTLVPALALGAAAGARAQPAWPTRPIQLIVPFAAGGGPDAIARPLAERLAALLGQPVTIVNRPGAAGNVGTAEVARAEPDGHSIVLASFATAVNRYLYRQMPFDGMTDLAPITHLTNAPLMLVVGRDSPFRSVADLVAHARQNPGRVSYGSAGAGSSIHLVTELFRANAGVNLLHVPYRGSAPAVTDILGGRLDMIFNPVPPSLPQLAAGTLRGLAVTSGRRLSSAPDVPTMTEAGISGFPADGWFALMAPARTPQPILERIATETRRALSEPATLPLLERVGNEVVLSDPAGLRRHIEAEMRRWEPIVRSNNIVLEG